MTSSRRAVVLHTRTHRDPVASTIAAIARDFDEVVIAIEDASRASTRPLWARWHTARARCQVLPHVWTTALAHSAGLTTRADRLAALRTRLGAFDRLYVDDARHAATARALGMPVELLAASEPEPQLTMRAATRALVVLRAQPFHRGHRALVEHALAIADEVVVLIAAAERSHAVRDPFTAGERLALVRVGLHDVLARVWLLAVAAPSWPGLSLPQLAWIAPSYRVVVTNNPVLRMLAEEHGQAVEGAAMVEADGAPLSATRVRARLACEGAGPWLRNVVPDATAALLRATPALAQRCAVLANDA